MTYRTPRATALAQRIAAMMPATEPVHQHASRGLDHGAWVPLRIMYPDADIPVLQMSLPTHDPQRLLAIGERLRPLRDEGVLIIGSGFLTHGLPFLTEFRIDAAAPGWSRDFDAWAGEALARGDVDALAVVAVVPVLGRPGDLLGDPDHRAQVLLGGEPVVAAGQLHRCVLGHGQHAGGGAQGAQGRRRDLRREGVDQPDVLPDLPAQRRDAALGGVAGPGELAHHDVDDGAGPFEAVTEAVDGSVRVAAPTRTR